MAKDVYGEVHHIIPKSEGGDNSNENLVRLSAREHYIAHLLLAKIYKDRNMYCAINMMRRVSDKFHSNSHLYSKMKEKYSKIVSEKMKGIVRRRGYHLSDEVKQKISEANKGKVRTLEMRKRQSDRQKGKPSSRKGFHHSDEMKIKLSIARKGKKLSDETRRKMSESRKGKPHKISSEAHEKQRQTLLMKYRNGEIEPWNKGKKMTEEYCNTMSEAQKKYQARKRGE